MSGNTFIYGNPLALPVFPPATEPSVDWQDRMVDGILRMYERGCSENQIRFWFSEQGQKREGTRDSVYGGAIRHGKKVLNDQT